MIAVKMIINPYVNLKNNLAADGWIQQNIFIEFSLFSFFTSFLPLWKKLFIEDIEERVNKYKLNNLSEDGEEKRKGS